MEKKMGDSYNTTMMVIVIKLSTRMEKGMEDTENTTRMESFTMMQYVRMARG